jgi:rare lipoprotein A
LNKAIFGIVALFVTASQVRAAWTGQASYYRETRHGALTAAHRTLPVGTHLLVTNLANGRAVIVVVVGRGPFIRSRILDVSTDAADALGFRSAGIAQVKIEVVEEAAPLAPAPINGGGVAPLEPLAPFALFLRSFIPRN